MAKNGPRVPDCLLQSGPLNETDLSDFEEWAFITDDVPQRIIQRLLIELRRARHALIDPMFMYSGSRIGRHAILCRNAENDRLREQVQNLKGASDGGHGPVGADAGLDDGRGQRAAEIENAG